MRSVELFAGAGGLALGVANAGFKHEAVVELNANACATLRENQARRIRPVSDWNLYQGDVRAFDFTTIPDGLDLLAAGPPCQPFSLGGKHRAHEDERDMFPEVARVVALLRPKAILVENVRGLTRQSFSRYFSYILLRLSYPEIVQRQQEDWLDHLARLERIHTKGGHQGLSYHVVFRVLNAADYGIPQRRERVFIVGFRSDLGIEFAFPKPTHSLDGLLWSQWITKEYWEEHEVSSRKRPKLSEAVETRVWNLRTVLEPPHESRWRTVRDAIGDLPNPTCSGAASVLNHVLNPGARAYPGHTGSPLDEPAKALKAGVHGVPGGENMLALPDGQVRYFTVRESARVQTFPDEYVFCGAWTEAMRQLGNAVPVKLAGVVASSVRAQLPNS